MTSAEESFRCLFAEVLLLPEDAQDWLMSFWQVMQVFDDVADGDAVPRKELDRCIWNTMVAMPLNRFYSINSALLIPVMVNLFLKWQASDQAERAGRATEMSYAWRAGFYDLILFVTHVCHGIEFATQNAEKVMKFYGETFEDYRKEFLCQGH
jgi:hypothetical protein